jgi:CubicO group peptidase (beta-lactamase class C family)
MARNDDAMPVEGEAGGAFAALRRTLAEVAARRGEGGCALAVYRRGEQVVDLWRSTESTPWREDTLVTVASCTKGAVAFCAQLLHDRGLLDVDAPVERYWPEYAASGKQDTLVRHLLEHTAGVLTFPRYWDVTGIDRSGLADWEGMTAGLATAPPSWQPGTQLVYHPQSFGFLVGEVIRRIDGRTVGRFLADEVAAPLGLELYIGAPESILPRVAPPLDAPAPSSDLLHAWSIARERVRAGDVLSMAALPWSMDFRHPDLEVDDLQLGYATTRRYLTAENPSANGITSARHLARLYALLAGGGELAGARLVSQRSIDRFRPPADGDGWGLGYARVPPQLHAHGVSESAFGHAGGGGHLAFVDPERELGFAFVQNAIHNDFDTAGALAAAVYACLDA